MRQFFEYIYSDINLALEWLDIGYIITTFIVSFMAYLKLHSMFVALLVFLILCYAGSKLLENTVYDLIGVFVFIFIGSLYYTHTLWPFSIIYAAIVYAYWYYYGKDPPLGSIKTEYSVGEELDPLTASFLIKENIDTFDIVATLYNLIRKGYIDVEIDKNDIYLKRKSSDRLLTGPEQFLMDRVFIMTGVEIASMGIKLNKDEFPDIVSFGSVLKGILEWLPAMERMIEKHVVEHGFYDYSPVDQRKYTKYLAYGFAVAFFVLLFAAFPIIMTPAFENKVVFYLIIPGLIPPVATYILSLYVTKRTHKGMESYRKVLGFREFLRRVEKPRLVWLIKQKNVDVEELFVYMISLKALGFMEKLKIAVADFKELNDRIQMYLKLDNFIRKHLAEAIREAERKKRQAFGEYDIFGGRFRM